MNNHLSTLIHEMARRAQVQLTDQHFSVLEYAYGYYEKNRIGPLYPNIQRNTGITRDQIDQLFPRGLSSVYTWIGIPMQTSEDGCKPMASVEAQDFRRVYLDHNATTYIRDEVRDRIIEHYQESASYGNPSSSTDLGKMAYDLVSEARESVAECLGVDPEEIIFTGCGSEANNMAIKGIALGHLHDPGHLVTSRVEHASVMKTFKYLESLGFEVTYLDAESDGRVSSDAVKQALRPDTRLVSLIGVNNEIGTVNPIEEIGAICQEAGVPFMIDGIQAFGKIPVKPKEMGISLMSMSGHKIYAPKGVAALYKSAHIELVPLIHGGGQEGGRRAGTEDVASVMAFGQAAKLIHREMASEDRRLRELRDYFLERLGEAVPEAIVNGCLENRVPNNLNIGFPRIDSGSLLLSLNRIGVYVSSGSACSAGSVEASHVITALGIDTREYGTVRFSFGKRTTREDIDYVFRYLPQILEMLREEKKEMAGVN